MYTILGAGITGCCIALYLSRAGKKVVLIDKSDLPMLGASLHNEGKLHLGYVYAADNSLKTTEVMQKGSLAFLDTLSDLLELPQEGFIKSQPFRYVVPTESMLAPGEIKRHFNKVDEMLDKSPVAINESALVSNQDLSASGYNLQRIQLGISTKEISVNPAQVGAYITGKVMADNNITVLINTQVVSAAPEKEGSFKISCLRNGQPITVEAQKVINCLWESRQFIDEMVGIRYEQEVLTRYKMAITFKDVPDRGLVDSSTFITGPFGDVVNYNNGDYFLSWYPKCRIGTSQTTDYSDIQMRLGALDKKQLIEDSIQGLEAFCPCISRLSDFTDKATVGGGYILSVGKTDIDDANSHLHKRYQIGYQIHGNWITVDTGKYCTGPYFASQVANLLIGSCKTYA